MLKASHTHNRPRTRAILLLAATLALPLLFASRSALAGTCYGAGCNGQDANATSCNNDAYTVACKSIVNLSGTVIGRVALRYSPSCRAAWGRTSTTVVHDWIYAYIGTPSNPILQSGAATGSFSAVLSPMFDAAQYLIASGSIVKANTNTFGTNTQSTYPITAPAVSCP